MKYIADLLTALRLILSIFIATVIFTHGPWLLAMIMFIAAILSDALDGTAARKWPYSPEENKKLWWRRDPHFFDNTADLALTLFTIVSLMTRSKIWIIVTVAVIVGTIILLESIKAIRPKHPTLAEKIDVFHGWCYATLLFAMLISMTVKATDKWLYIVIVYCLAALLFIILKWDRVVSRPETRNNK